MGVTLHVCVYDLPVHSLRKKVGSLNTKVEDQCPVICLVDLLFQFSHGLIDG